MINLRQCGEFKNVIFIRITKCVCRIRIVQFISLYKRLHGLIFTFYR